MTETDELHPTTASLWGSLDDPEFRRAFEQLLQEYEATTIEFLHQQMRGPEHFADWYEKTGVANKIRHYLVHFSTWPW